MPLTTDVDVRYPDKVVARGMILALVHVGYKTAWYDPKTLVRGEKFIVTHVDGSNVELYDEHYKEVVKVTLSSGLLILKRYNNQCSYRFRQIGWNRSLASNPTDQ